MLEACRPELDFAGLTIDLNFNLEKNMKLKLIAAAAMFAVAGQAAASIADGTTGNGELFLSVYDSVAQVSYTRDLGVTLSDFSSNLSSTSYSLNFASDALLQSAFASLSGLSWNVAALDSTGGTAVGGQHYLSTTNADQATVQNTKNSSLTVGMSGVNGYVQANNAFGTHVSSANGSSTAVFADGAAYFGNGFAANWLGKASFDSTALVGNSLGFFLMETSVNAIGANALKSIQATQAAGTWTLASNGDLSYSVPAPVAAVPVPAALWLLGSGLIGMVGVARRKSA
ncbi:hypothetical protein SCD_n02832 [Sulfuricella denitrificans skB26]|uniref:VPLPA-CTERM sorting domain-containing protein n=1 Tax=Sulfuricella denitrificans (strain DSM 22764 / NBRC 105220 / skB26) TaxID=1163617 RepID=S6AJT4_SULDS|nr:VPLPA-CTERM sorting domain-containing protein [Sulfuricella denitrificans]BAN36631.1 hypothetical protein SCD_n02832 [Sulfuricella denitrificans skB26]